MELEHNVDAMLQQLKAPPAHAMVSTLSGGELRRVALAKTLLANADADLDGATNHLDAQTIEWLEAFEGYRCSACYPRSISIRIHCHRIVESEENMVSYEDHMELFDRMQSDRSAWP